MLAQKVMEEGLEFYEFCSGCTTRAFHLSNSQAHKKNWSYDVFIKFLFKVPEMGLEPISLATHDFESCAYTNSATPAL